GCGIAPAGRSFRWSNAWAGLCLSLLEGRQSLARCFRAYNRALVPELPDITIVAEAFHAALGGRLVTGAEAPGPLAVRGTPAELGALPGQRLMRVRRRGKFLIVDLERGQVV